MNLNLYEIQGPHKDTNRVRTVRIPALSEENATQKALNEGLLSIKSIRLIQNGKPSDRQIAYAQGVGIKVLDSYSAEDLSALLSRHEDHDSEPKAGLIEFATSHDLYFSKLIGKTALYNHIFSKLPDLDRVAFFIFCIYRYISDDREPNLDKHIHNKLFYDFANQTINDKKFMNSLNRYTGKQLKFFGNLIIGNGTTLTGGSTSTIAFKTAHEFLIKNNLVQASDKFQTKKLNNNPQPSQQPPSPILEPSKAKGCGTAAIMFMGVSMGIIVANFIW